MRAVERVNESAVRQARPAGGLHRATHLQRELVRTLFPLGRDDAALAREPPEGSVRADVVEAVIVDADMREVRRHALDRARPAKLEKVGVTGRVILQQRGSELKPLGPFGPPARPVAPFDGEHRRAVLGPPAVFDRPNLACGQLEEPRDLRFEVARQQAASEMNHRLLRARHDSTFSGAHSIAR
jgi:hypothetical protein